MNMYISRLDKLSALEKDIKYTFTDKALLNAAFIHTSYANENSEYRGRSNERLEFLGDAVLETVYSEIIFKKFINKDEGILTKLRASLVREESFAELADRISLSSYLLLGKGEDKTGGREKPSIKADAFEAFCGAMYLDGGYKVVYTFIYDLIEDMISTNEFSKDQVSDYKSMLQEHLHKYKNINCEYKLVKELGPSHDKEFFVEVYKDKNRIGQGSGKNKKLAEQMAAKNALENLKVIK